MRGSNPPATIPPGNFGPGRGNYLGRSCLGGRVMEQITKLLRARGLSNAMATHRLPDVKRFCAGKPIDFVSVLRISTPIYPGWDASPSLGYSQHLIR